MELSDGFIEELIDRTGIPIVPFVPWHGAPAVGGPCATGLLNFPMFPLHYACSCVWWLQIVPVNVRSVELLWKTSACSALEFLSVESDLLDIIHAYFLDTFGIAKSRKCLQNCICNQCIWINSRSQVQNWKSVLLIFIIDYSAQEKESGNGMKKWKGEKGPPLILAWCLPRA